ncbi:MAG TPA: CCA tRNA nucleotidyltransferase [Kofleriaceae bacterium]|nr:CCA tRNA nucleotidyltransferase [Kofleriaceae bacterium]
MDAQVRLAEAVPARVLAVCTTLEAAGYEAVIVGGCVRDVILGRNPKDWDVATSAHPDEVLKLFRHTIATGLQHGTVTVVTGKGKETHVEVTTFRGEGAYSDARRPDQVTFGVPLVEDLARRDLTVNAIAYDAAKKSIVDPFGGIADIESKKLRAVGTAVDRFTEDGLRVMRAVRFAAQLEFDLEPDTEASIAPALPSLSKVSRERVCDELRKLLEARQPSRGLDPAVRTGILANILPELPIVDAGEWLARIDRAPVEVRLAAMMIPLGDGKRTADILKALKFSNQEAELASVLVEYANVELEDDQPPTVRRMFADIAKPKRRAAIALWTAMPRPALAKVASEVISDPLDTGDLAVKGKDIMTALAIEPGPKVGRILEVLLERVLENPALNTREKLIDEAQRLELELPL